MLILSLVKWKFMSPIPALHGKELTLSKMRTTHLSCTPHDMLGQLAALPPWQLRDVPPLLPPSWAAESFPDHFREEALASPGCKCHKNNMKAGSVFQSMRYILFEHSTQTVDQAAKHLFNPEIGFEDRNKTVLPLSSSKRLQPRKSPLAVFVPIFRQYPVTCSSILNAAEAGHGMPQRTEPI